MYTGDTERNPPLVRAVEAASDDDVVIIENAISANEDQPLLPNASRNDSLARSVEVEAQQQQQPLPDGEENTIPHIETDEEKREKARSMGAGIASGIIGSLICGPIIGILLGFGAAYAVKKEGAVGDSARAIGDVALHAQAKAKEVDEKHKVVDKCREGAGKAWEKAKEMDRKHNILTKTKDFVAFCAISIKDFCQQHRVLERSVDGASRCATWASSQITNAVESNSNNSATSGGDSARQQ